MNNKKENYIALTW